MGGVWGVPSYPPDQGVGGGQAAWPPGVEEGAELAFLYLGAPLELQALALMLWAPLGAWLGAVARLGALRAVLGMAETAGERTPGTRCLCACCMVIGEQHMAEIPTGYLHESQGTDICTA